MNVYVSDILAAFAAFAVLALALTAPYMIYQYRKRGSVPWLRTLVIYSFAFYLLCAYFLVLLPLPADRTAYVPYAAAPQLVPFKFVAEIAREAHISANPATWIGFASTPAVYEAFFNLLLTLPFGVYLRYFFRRTWWQTLALGFCLTLSFETLQLTGLLGIYAHPYRLFDVDDLIANTLGSMIGFWMAGPAMCVLPDVRLIDAEAQEAGMRASVTRRALSFFIDLLIAQVASGMLAGAFGLAAGIAAAAGGNSNPAQQSSGFEGSIAEWAAFALVFAVVPALTQGKTPGQALLRLVIVRPDASPARWYQPAARYGILFLIVWLPFALIEGLEALGEAAFAQSAGLAGFVAGNSAPFALALWAVMFGWIATLSIRALRSAVCKRPFVMLNGILSNTRVMTSEGVKRERARRRAMDVKDVVALEQKIASEGTPLAVLMSRAGAAVADEVRTWVPDPSSVVVLAGSGNNGGDGWVAAQLLARDGYRVTLVTPKIAEEITAEPARTTALKVFSDAAAQGLPLHVLVAPDADVLADAVDGAASVVDAVLGTGFSGEEVREPYASWIEAANRRRFEGSRGKGRGKHRKRVGARGKHERYERVRKTGKTLPPKAKDAPFALAVDVPSGLSAQTGAPALPCFAADMTVTMLAFKTGLVAPSAGIWTGIIHLAPLVSEGEAS